MSLFNAILVSAKAASDAVFGEAVRILPTVASGSVNAKGRAIDVDRPAFDFTARFYEPTDLITAPDRRDVLRSGMSDRALNARGVITATIDYPPHKLRHDDLIKRNSNQVWYQITDVDGDGTGTFILSLSPAQSVLLEE